MAHGSSTRNSLFLGLGLALGGASLLLAATTQALSSYAASVNIAYDETMQTVMLDDLKPDVRAMQPNEPSAFPIETREDWVEAPKKLEDRLTSLRAKLHEFKRCRAKCAGQGPQSHSNVDCRLFDDIDKSLDAFAEFVASQSTDRDRQFDQANRLLQLVDELRLEISTDMLFELDKARSVHRQGVWKCLGLTAAGLAPLAAFLCLFVGWMRPTQASNNS
jgi:hypothetical protein